MKNTVFGKTIDNLRNRINVKLANNGKGYLNWISKSRFMLRKTLENDLATASK